ncbi:MAG: hypothetical protein ACK4F7_10700 [Inhella sp.]
MLLGPLGGLITSLASLERLADALRRSEPRLLSAAGHARLRQPLWQWQAGEPAETEGGLFRAWSAGAQCFRDQAGGDRLRRRGGLSGFGHLASAYGLLGGLVVNPASGQQSGWCAVYLLHGAVDAPGRYSAFNAAEESLLDRLLDPLPT